MIFPAVIAVASLATIFYPRQVGAVAQRVFGPFQLYGPPMQSNIENTAYNIARDHLIRHEGRRNDVYKDSLGVLTVGIGHKVTAADGLRFGQRITDAQIDALFETDIAQAFAAAKSQALELRKYNADMIAALTSVNFQLGIYWRSKFSGTWNDLKNDNLQGAVRRLQNSAWRSQTPARVADFVAALERNFA